MQCESLAHGIYRYLQRIQGIAGFQSVMGGDVDLEDINFVES
ncbi:MAG: hypothetical protein ABIL40_00545 [candidate division WOR-3 bacterium]